MNLDPRIGMLNSRQFYAFVDGYDAPEVVGTLAEVETALGLRPPATMPIQPVKKSGAALRPYQVTVTPSTVTYAGSDTYGEYIVDIDARSHSEAITKVRAARNAAEGRYRVRATYRAKRV